MANHPTQIWSCHWELQVFLESIWSMCGYVLFDIMTNPSCTSGCRIAQKKDSFLLGRTVVTFFHFAPYFSHIKKKKKKYEEVPFLHLWGLLDSEDNCSQLVFNFRVCYYYFRPKMGTLVLSNYSSSPRKRRILVYKLCLECVCLYPPPHTQGWAQGDNGIVKAFVL